MRDKSQSTRVGMRILRISALMAAIYVFFHLLPDFAPETPETLLRQVTGDTSPELCDVDSLGFTQVTRDRSPLEMRLVADAPPEVGKEVRVTLALNRPGGDPVRFDDLEEVHTEKFHLLVVDPSLADYHHEHPVPTAVPGEYIFSFVPEKEGNYRLFADLLPRATGRPVQAVADLEVPGKGEAVSTEMVRESVVDRFHFTVTEPDEGFRSKKPALVSLRVRHESAGEPVTLEPVMGAYAHLVAFDSERSGFAHMHPVQEGLEVELDETEPKLDFIFYAEEPGAYTVWAQVKIEGEERFAPFVVNVL